MKKNDRRRDEKPLRLGKKRQGKKRCPSAAFAKLPLRSRPESALKAPHSRICGVQRLAPPSCENARICAVRIFSETLPHSCAKQKDCGCTWKRFCRSEPLFRCLTDAKSARALTPPKNRTRYPLPVRKSLRAKSLCAALFLPTAKKTPPQKRGRCKGFLLSRLAAILPEKGVDAELRNEKLFVTSGDG